MLWTSVLTRDPDSKQVWSGGGLVLPSLFSSTRDGHSPLVEEEAGGHPAQLSQHPGLGEWQLHHQDTPGLAMGREGPLRRVVCPSGQGYGSLPLHTGCGGKRPQLLQEGGDTFLPPQGSPAVELSSLAMPSQCEHHRAWQRPESPRPAVRPCRQAWTLRFHSYSLDSVV